jgi:hypothetical protein
MILEQAAIEREARDVRGVLQAIEFFFFDSEEHALFVDKRDRGTVAERRDAEEVYVLFDQPAPCSGGRGLLWMLTNFWLWD